MVNLRHTPCKKVQLGCKFPVVCTCQKLWKLADSRQSYCKNKQAYFFGPPCVVVKLWQLLKHQGMPWNCFLWLTV